MGYSREKPNRKGQGEGVRIWNFEGYQRNSIWNLQDWVKTKGNFQGWPRKNNVEFPGVFIFGLGISLGSNAILWNIQGWSYILSGISRVKYKNEKYQGFFLKRYVLNPPCFFWNRPMSNGLIVVKALDSQSRGLAFKNHRVAPRLTQPFFFWGW